MLPKPRYFQFTRGPGAAGTDKIQIMDVASFKGLEADSALLLFSDCHGSLRSPVTCSQGRRSPRKERSDTPAAVTFAVDRNVSRFANMG
jgi:hypothetical protein